MSDLRERFLRALGLTLTVYWTVQLALAEAAEDAMSAVYVVLLLIAVMSWLPRDGAR